MVAAAHVHTIKTLRAGPGRRLLPDPGDVDGVVTPPASRFMALIGAPMLSFYDWYADLPVASPAGVRRPDRRARVRRLVGRLLPDPVGLERPGDPHAGRALDDRGPLPRPEGRRDEPRLLRRHQVRRRLAGARTPAPTARWRWRWATSSSRSSSSTGRCRGSPTTSSATPTCRSCVTLDAARRRATCPGKFLTAADLGDVERGRGVQDGAARRRDRASRRCRTARSASASARPGKGRWNLDLGDVDPLLTLLRTGGEPVAVDLPRFDTAARRGRGRCAAACPVRRVGEQLVTTVYDLLLAQYGVGRPGLPGEWPTGYDDADAALHAGLAGAVHRRVRRPPRRGSAGSSRRTPRSPAAAR